MGAIFAGVERIDYRGITYTRNPDGKRRSNRVYWAARRGSGGTLLHRDVYLAEVGPIPTGWHVHHVDGDPLNNDPANLIALSPSDHAKVHPGLFNKRSLEWRAHLADIRPSAAEWHGSPEGLEWHRQHGARTWEGREGGTGTCQECGKEMVVWFEGKRFCSRACIMREYERTQRYHKDVPCPICGATFKQRYGRPKTCSRRCTAQLRQRGV